MTEVEREDRIILVGAGLVGSLLSIFLARRGFASLVLERRPDMRRQDIPAGRSINLAISTRGIRALEEVAVADDIMSHAVPMRGRMIHPVSGPLAFQPYGKDESEFINSISRGTLNKSLMHAAERTGLVEFRFNRKVTGIRFEDNTLAVQNEETGEIRQLTSPVVIGTDGTASAIRQEMQRLPGYTSTEELLEYGYKELVIPPTKAGGFAMERNALHIWPRGTYMLIALPNFEGSFTCTLFLPFQGTPGFEILNSEERVRRFFSEQFPDALPLIENMEETFFTNPTGHMVTVKCLPWHVGGSTLLMGDAAHGMVPFFGQGMNCGFEDCSVFARCLDERLQGKAAPDAQTFPWALVFEEFFQLRKENTDAISDMAVENFIEMRDKVGDPRFLLEKGVEKILQNEFPGRYISRYCLVTFSCVPYKLALEVGAVQREMLSRLCRDIEKPEDVDLKMAEKLIDSELSHLLLPFGKELASSAKQQ